MIDERAEGASAPSVGRQPGGGPIAKPDEGRFALTKNEADRFFFKVPSLRNIEKTAPYFHDGSSATLDEAVTRMAQLQLGRDLTPAQTKLIVTFLKVLTGDLPSDAIAEPQPL